MTTEQAEELVKHLRNIDISLNFIMIAAFMIVTAIVYIAINKK